MEYSAFTSLGGVLTLSGIDLSKIESAVLVRQLGKPLMHRPGARLIAEGESLERPRLIRSGWACRVWLLRDGRRQILNYYLPGDVMGLSIEPKPVALAAYVSLTRLMTVDFGPVRSLALERPQDFPSLMAACRRIRVLEEHYLLSQITRIGRQKAYERVAHLLLELHSRLKRAGLAERDTFQLPLTQEALADGLGLSAVHVNRTFKLLKQRDLVRVERNAVILLKPAALAGLSGYREPGEPEGGARDSLRGRTAPPAQGHFGMTPL